MGRYIDLTGKKFGRLLAIKYAGCEENGGALWDVRCECGNVFTTSARNLVHGFTRSCGCLRRDLLIGKPSRNKGGYKWNQTI
jgi:hypothetical protein